MSKLKKYLILLVCLFLSYTIEFADPKNIAESLKIQKMANSYVKRIRFNKLFKGRKEKLKKLSEKWDKEWKIKKQKAIDWAKRNNIQIKRKKDKGGMIQLMYLTEKGRPIFYSTKNLNSAKTQNVDDVWPGGSAGLALSGGSVILGEWDGDKVNTTHNEFGGRAIQRDGVGSLGDHATHVAGTIIAGGVTANAKGMSYNGTLWAHDWDNDASEMSSEASLGLRVSNHSYGPIQGWSYDDRGDGEWCWYGDPSVATNEDYLFGFYDSYYAKDFDDIAYNAPYYLICVAAGNDGEEGPSDNGTSGHWVVEWTGSGYNYTWSTTAREVDGGTDGYDNISGAGIGKNVLCVGAVDDISGGYSSPSDVRQTGAYFSSHGPVDDGRIKPDIVANGYQLYSTLETSNSAYGYMSGTSMATPSVTGGLGLLIEHYQKTHSGDSMLASTLKALIINTANEAGSADGPDYKFGWGLLDVKKAAQLITDDNGGTSDLMIEDSLSNGEQKQFVYEAKGSEDIKVTICWTDPSHSVPSAALNSRTKMLVNDLDLRLSSAGVVTSPWTLDVENPSTAAARGDNTIDNVEQVYIKSPTAGSAYVITVSHKGTLSSAPQSFSMVISGLKVPTSTTVSSGDTFLFDASHAQMAANADWVVDADQWNLNSNGVPTGTESNPQRYPTPSNPTHRDAWTGGSSSWGYGLYTMGYGVESLTYDKDITYNDGSNSQDLSNYRVIIITEPNNQLTASEKTALMSWIAAGGGLFMCADHYADRNWNGWAAVSVLNELESYTGIHFQDDNAGEANGDISNITTKITTQGTSLEGDSLCHSYLGNVTTFKVNGATTLSLSTATNPTVKGHIWMSTASVGDADRVLVATCHYGKGNIVALVDSSPPDDGTGDPNDTLYNNWDDYTPNGNSRLILNASEWLLDKIAPSAVTDLAASTGDTLGSVQLDWTSVGDDDSWGTATTYLIRWSASPITSEIEWISSTEVTNSLVPQVSGTAETFKVTGLIPGDTFYFCIRVMDEKGNISPLSNSPSAMASLLGSGELTITLPEDGYATNVISITVSGTSAYFDEGDSVGLYLLSGVQLGNTVAIQANADSSWSITGCNLIANDFNYIFAVSNDGVRSVNHLIIHDNVAPTTITDLHAINADSDRIQLSWTAISDVDTAMWSHYEIFYSTSSPVTIADNKWDTSNDPFMVNKTLTSTTITGLTPGTTYYFAIRGIDVVPNYGNLSNEADTKTLSTTFIKITSPIDNNFSIYYTNISPITISGFGVDVLQGDSVGVYNQNGILGGDSAVILNDSTWIRTNCALTENETNYIAAYLAAADYPSEITIVHDNVKPNQIIDLTIDSIGSDSIALSWTADTQVDTAPWIDYKIYYGTSPIVTTSDLVWDYTDDSNLDDKPTNSTVITGLDTGTHYYFIIVVSDSVNISDTSNTVDDTTYLGPWGIEILSPVHTDNIYYTNVNPIVISGTSAFLFDGEEIGVYNQNGLMGGDSSTISSDAWTRTNCNLITNDTNNIIAFYSLKLSEAATIVHDNIVPSQVSDFAIGTVTTTSISVDWTALTDVDTAPWEQYTLYYSTSSPVDTSSANSIVITSKSSSTYNITGLDTNTQYYFTIVGSDLAGNTGVLAVEISDTTYIGTRSLELTYPIYSDDVYYTNVNPIVISGTTVSAFDGDLVGVYNQAGLLGGDSAVVGSQAWTRTNCMLIENDTNNISAYMIDAGAAYNKIVHDNLCPDTVTDLRVNGYTYYSVSLGWTPTSDTNFAKYEIYYHTSSFSDTTVATKWDYINDSNLLKISTNATSIQGLTNATEYYFRLVAIDILGQSSISSETNILLSDYPLDSFVIQAPEWAYVNEAWTCTMTAWSIEPAIKTDFEDSVSLHAETGNIIPSQSNLFTAGILIQDFVMDQAGESIIVSIEAVSGAVGFNGYFDDLVISEVMEADGTRSYLELANFTGADVDLSNYSIKRYNSGYPGIFTAPLCTQIQTVGILPNNSTVVIYDDVADLDLASLAYSVHDGDYKVSGDAGDAVVLVKNGVEIDLFDPGDTTSWTLKDYRRNLDSAHAPSMTFYPEEWTVYEATIGSDGTVGTADDEYDTYDLGATFADLVSGTFAITIRNRASLKITYPDTMTHDTWVMNIDIEGTTLNTVNSDTIELYVNGVFNDLISLAADTANWSGTVHLTQPINTVVAVLTDEYSQLIYDTIIVNFINDVRFTYPVYSEGIHDTNVTQVIVSGTSFGTFAGDTIEITVQGLAPSPILFDSSVLLTNDGNWTGDMSSFVPIVTLSNGANIMVAHLTDDLGRDFWDTITINYKPAGDIAILYPDTDVHDTYISPMLVSGTTLSSFTGNTVVIYVNTISQASYILTSDDGDWNGNITLTEGINTVESYLYLSDTEWVIDWITVNYYLPSTIGITYPDDVHHDTNINEIVVSGTTDSYIGDTVLIMVNGVVNDTFIVTANDEPWSGTAYITGINDSVVAVIIDKFDRENYDTITVSYYPAPLLGITYPDILEHDTNIQEIVVAGTSGNSNLGDSIELFVDGVLVNTLTLSGANANWSGTVVLNSIADSVVAVITNPVGDKFYDTITVNYFAPISLEIIYPDYIEHDTFINYIDVGGTTNGTYSGDTVELFVNGNLMQTIVLTGQNQSWQDSVTLFGIGDSVVAKLTDQHFGVEYYDTITVNYFGVPIIEIIYPDYIEHDTTIQEIYVSGTADIVMDGDSVILYVNGNFMSVISVSGGSWSGTVLLEGMGDSVQAVVENQGGGLGYDTITVNWLPPQIEIHYPTTTTHDTNVSPIVIGGTTYLTNSGDWIQLYVNGNVQGFPLTLTTSDSDWIINPCYLSGYNDVIVVELTRTDGRQAWDTIIINFASLDHFVITGPDTAYFNETFSLSLTAYDSNNVIAGGFSDRTNMTVETGAIIPFISGYFSNGTLIDDFQIDTVANNITITASCTYVGNQITEFEGFETNNFTNLSWTNVSAIPWTIDSIEKKTGSYSAKSGAIGNSANSQLIMSNWYTANNGKISFWKKLSCDTSDRLVFWIDGSPVADWGGIEDWSYVTYDVTAGTHTFEWWYVKTAADTAGEDAVWIDNVTLPISSEEKIASGTHVINILPFPEVEIYYPISNIFTAGHDTTVQEIVIMGNAKNLIGDTIYLYVNGILNSVIPLTAADSTDWSGTVLLQGIGDSVVAKITDQYIKVDYDTIMVNYQGEVFVEIDYPDTDVHDTNIQTITVSGTGSMNGAEVGIYVNGNWSCTTTVSGTQWTGTAGLIGLGDSVVAVIVNGTNYGYDTITVNFDNIAPDTPTGLIAIADVILPDTGVLLTWNANTEVDFSYYNIYRDTTGLGGSNYIWIASVYDTTLFDSLAVQGDSQFYSITAVDSFGNESGFSDSASAANVYCVKIVNSIKLNNAIAPLIPGATVEYFIEYYNNGFAPGYNVEITDTIPYTPSAYKINSADSMVYLTDISYSDDSGSSWGYSPSGTSVDLNVKSIRWTIPAGIAPKADTSMPVGRVKFSVIVK